MHDSLRPALLDWLQRHKEDMIELLACAVNIDSGSHNKSGVDRMGHLFKARLERAGLTTTTHQFEAQGDCLSCEIGSGSSEIGGHILLLGHMDTVFPIGTAERRPFRIEGNTAYGPGVADMKAGLVMNLFVALAFAELDASRVPLRLLFTGDEEIASPASRVLTQNNARGALAVFNAEPGRPSGNVVTVRKGVMFFDFEVDGVAAHAGAALEKGASAIEALARKIVRLYQLSDPDTGISINVGTVRGGMTVNTVADFAAGQFDMRFPGGIDSELLRTRILEIIEDESPPGTRGRITGQGVFLPLHYSEANQRLLATYHACAESLGFAVEGESTGGAADSGLTAAVGAPTLCAVGPVGGNVHTDREYCSIDTLVPRAQALALTIRRFPDGTCRDESILSGC